jgi:hypothetical protein
VCVCVRVRERERERKREWERNILRGRWMWGGDKTFTFGIDRRVSSMSVHLWNCVCVRVCLVSEWVVVCFLLSRPPVMVLKRKNPDRANLCPRACFQRATNRMELLRRCAGFGRGGGGLGFWKRGKTSSREVRAHTLNRRFESSTFCLFLLDWLFCLRSVGYSDSILNILFFLDTFYSFVGLSWIYLVLTSSTLLHSWTTQPLVTKNNSYKLNKR